MARFPVVLVSASVAAAAIGAVGLAAQNERPGGYPTATAGGFSEPGPDRRPGEGNGPFSRLVIRGATVIDGTGAPPQGPVDIVIERNRIVELRNVGYPGLSIRPEQRPAKGDYEIDASACSCFPA
jgi:hypothetical protein